MSDLEWKIRKPTHATVAWLERLHRKTGRSKPDILRDALHRIAMDAINDAKSLIDEYEGVEAHDGPPQPNDARGRR